eukprot:scaffold282_cov118-Isochrysis_galbana.AAC.4
MSRVSYVIAGRNVTHSSIGTTCTLRGPPRPSLASTRISTYVEAPAPAASLDPSNVLPAALAE